MEGLTFSSASYTYDGTEKALAVTGTLPTGANVAYTNERATAAGTYNATATVTCEGYSTLNLTATLTIRPKELTIDGLRAQNKTYDATDAATLTGGTLTGVLAGDAVSAAIPTAGKFASKDAGTGIAVSIDPITLTGANAGSYTLTQPSGLRADITKAPLSIRANDKQMTVGGAVPALDHTVTSGRLFGSDTLTGALQVNTNGSTAGTFPIRLGTLSAGANYDIDFTEGTLTVSTKPSQNILVDDLAAKTYGDAPFRVGVTADEASGLTAFTYESSNPAVAAVDAQGNVTILAAGETDITVRQAGNADYAPFERTQTLRVAKVAITVKADAKSKKVGSDDPALTYTHTGTLVGGDAFTGSLTRERGESEGRYRILQGSLALSSNYALTYEPAYLEIVEKTPQNIRVDDLTAKTYGDAPFRVGVTADATSGLTAFTYESSNPAVAAVDAQGNITILAAGETDITVRQAGNADYAPFERTQTLQVACKGVEVTQADPEQQTATLTGVLPADTDVKLDFTKLRLEIVEPNGETSMKVKLLDLTLTGEKSENYTVTTASVEAVLAAEKIVTVTLTAENGTVTGAGSYLTGNEVTVTATADSGYFFNGWYKDDEKISAAASYTFVPEGDTQLEARFKRYERVDTVEADYSVSTDITGDGAVELSVSSAVRGDTVSFLVTPGKGQKLGSLRVFDSRGKEITCTSEGSGRYSFPMPAKRVTVEAVFAPANDFTTCDGTNCPIHGFRDVDSAAWYHDGLHYCVEQGLMNGTGSGLFQPAALTTRATVAVMLWRLSGSPVVDFALTFADMAEGQWYTDAVRWAVSTGLMNGYGNGLFGTDDAVTREQLVTILHRYARSRDMDVSVGEDTNILSYADALTVSDFAAEAMQWACGSGIVTGKTDGSALRLDPMGSTTRAEMATVMMRFYTGSMA